MKKIMFNDKYGLTNAVLEGRKTMTRRIIPVDETQGGLVPVSFWNGKWVGAHGRPLKRQPYKIGEVVAVAQSYKDAGILYDERTDEILEGCAGWTNKMFVTGYNMPHQIRITNVRIERLQDISDEDCMLEGIYKQIARHGVPNLYAFDTCLDQYGDVLAKIWYADPRAAFAALIDKISGRGTFESNPWVFVYDFELVK